MRIVILLPLADPSARYGTELVAHDLAQTWQAGGCEVTLIGHSTDIASVESRDAGAVPVIALPPLGVVPKWTDFRMRTEKAPGLVEALEVAQPDIVLVVGLGPHTINLRHLEIISSFGIPCAVWHHVPGITCMQHGLRYKNRSPCNGSVVPRRCTTCRLTAAGVPELLADLASFLNVRGFESRLPRGLDHVVAGRAMSEAFAKYITALRHHVARIFVGANWVGKVLQLNGFTSEQIKLVRPGVRREIFQALEARPPEPCLPNGPLRLVFWGRLDDTKGVDTAIDAVRRLKNLDLRLKIIGSFDRKTPYHMELAHRASTDPRIHFMGRLEAAELAKELRDADVALIPSTWLETGPLTVFEARAAGLPILGARTGGVEELCSGDSSARLFERCNDHALAALITELATNPAEHARRRAAVPRARKMSEAAIEVLDSLRDMVATGSGHS